MRTERYTTPHHGQQHSATGVASDLLIRSMPAAGHGWDYDADAAHLLSIASGWSYADLPTFQDVIARVGFSDAECTLISVRNDALFVFATAQIIRSADNRQVVVCFRGTEPANILNWMTDASVRPVPYLQGMVHGGFLRNFQAIWPGILDELGEVDFGDDAPAKALYFTGHSLGGAMAALAGYTVWFDGHLSPLRAALRGVYTFGQPMCFDPDTARRCEPELAKRVFRHVYGRDIAPHMPPASMGRFSHFGREYVSAQGRWRERTQRAQQVTSLLLSGPISALAFGLQLFPRMRGVRLPYSIADHGPHHYIDCSPRSEGTELTASSQPHVFEKMIVAEGAEH